LSGIAVSVYDVQCALAFQTLITTLPFVPVSVGPQELAGAIAAATGVTDPIVGLLGVTHTQWQQTRQARKIHSRQHELRDVPRVKISAPNDSTFQLRAQSRREGMATLLAIAAALGIIEGDAVALQLMQLYQARVARTLGSRGLLPKHSEWNDVSLMSSKVL
jgi:DTW domain-containing protein YfiP